MKKIKRAFVELLEKAGHRCEQCGAEETEERRLKPYFVDGNKGNVTPFNLVVLCAGCCIHVAKLWPAGSNWEMGAPAWAINRGYFKKFTRAEIEAKEEKIKRAQTSKQNVEPVRAGSGHRAGKIAAKILREGKSGRGRGGRRK